MEKNVITPFIKAVMCPDTGEIRFAEGCEQCKYFGCYSILGVMCGECFIKKKTPACVLSPRLKNCPKKEKVTE